MDKKDRIIKELQNAYKAQQENKDGLARVCARRAAGWAIQIKLKEQGSLIFIKRIQSRLILNLN